MIKKKDRIKKYEGNKDNISFCFCNLDSLFLGKFNLNLMKNKFLVSGSIIIIMLLFIFSCRKEEQPIVGLKNKEKAFSINLLSTSCSGTETHTTKFNVSSNPNFFTRQTIKKVTEYFCDGGSMGADTLTILDDFYQGSEPEPGPSVNLFENVQGSYSISCSGTVSFNLNNVIYYNSEFFANRVSDAVAMTQIMSDIENYNYTGPYVIADLNAYGPNSQEKLKYAVFGYYMIYTFGQDKARTLFNNVPASPGGYPCEQLAIKLAGIAGINDYHSYETTDEVYNHFILEIMAYRL
ncbi:hypothetical protein [Pedobacter mendelii]|uniref:Uncharacterized protein n=1 Tax=Pedobacter mendelii TaxID=1908240 RepID=A0ABQ2BI20_9SPHI|nr:hypothetical protein [Pedobacter mendelii]GGI26578.1 hypothetical protein GCM10008119_23350 [Pedobacter mendelii]